MADVDPLREARVFEEFLQLQRDPVLRGEGVPAGDGRRVLVLPGLFANDIYLSTVRVWLSRIGYLPLASEVPLNVGCPRRVWERAATVVERTLADMQPGEPPLALVGHSRGGLLAKALSHRFSDAIDRMIVVGSPLGGMMAAGREGMQAFTDAMQASDSGSAGLGVFRAGRAVSRMLDPECQAPVCDCNYMDALLAPIPGHITTTSIFSPTDAVVPAMTSALPGALNLQVEGSHGGLMHNSAVFRHLADALAHP